MITKVDSSNLSKYKELFTKANTLLNISEESADAITTIDQFFQHLGEIAEADPSLIILPLDENRFEIDGNTRKIKIPQAFTSNGIGVQGDHYAEYIYFEIDRYFENIDFGSPTINAVVEFMDAKGQKHFQKAWIKYVDRDATKVIIGWPITQDVTSKAGTIKFSVRLFELDGTSYKRSFGTLIGQLVVNPSLDFSISTAEEDGVLGNLAADVQKEVMDRMVSSPSESYTEADVTSPKFTYRYTGAAPADPCIAEAGDVLKVQAVGEGKITYAWYKDDSTKSLDGDFDAYEKLEAYKDNIDIYQNIGTDQDKKWRLATDVTAENFANGEYYERYSKYALAGPDAETEVQKDIVGTYRCVAVNNMYGYSRSSNSAVKKIDPSDSDDLYKIGSVKVPGPTTFSDEGKVVIEGQKDLAELTSLVVNAGAKEDKDVDVYSWSFEPDADDDALQIAQTDGTVTPDKVHEGVYRASVARSRNGRTSDSLSLGSCHVYIQPQPIKFMTIGGKSVSAEVKSYGISNASESFHLVIQTAGKNENYEVKWFQNDGDSDVEISFPSVGTPKKDGQNIDYEFSAKGIKAGEYYPVVTISKNNVSGVEAIENSFEEDVGYVLIASGAVG